MRLLNNMLIPMIISLLTVTAAAQDERQELKESMRKRYPLRAALTDMGKIGEVDTGYVDVLKDAYRSEKADPKDDASPTIGSLVDAENTDRRRLYALLAKDLEKSPQDVATQNAIRSFKKAKPEHYLKVSGKVWIQKKHVKDTPDGEGQ
jgi:hypothetical protein